MLCKTGAKVVAAKKPYTRVGIPASETLVAMHGPQGVEDSIRVSRGRRFRWPELYQAGGSELLLRIAGMIAAGLAPIAPEPPAI